MIVNCLAFNDGRVFSQVRNLVRDVYEFTFHAREYLAGSGAVLTDPPFLADIVIRLGIADSTGHYHLPLLLSPYGCSVYRGS